MRDDFNIPNLGQAPKDYDEGYLNRVVRNVEMVFSTLRAKGRALFTDITADTVTATTVTAETVEATTSVTTPSIFTTNIDAETLDLIRSGIPTQFLRLGPSNGPGHNVTAYSPSTNAKGILYDATTDVSNTAPSGGSNFHDFRIRGVQKFLIGDTGAASFANSLTAPTITGSTSVSSAAFISTSPTGLLRNIDNGVLQISGGMTAGDGANIELYGPTGGAPGAAFYDATAHTFRSTGGAALIPIVSAGVTFPATQISSAGANTLDDYEEGSWTPVLSFGGGTTGITYGTQVGQYNKIGKFVHIEGEIILTNKGSSTGQAVIGGVPFGHANARGGVNWFYYEGMTGLSDPTGAYVYGGTAIALVSHSATGTTGLANTNFNNNSRLIFSGEFMAAS